MSQAEFLQLVRQNQGIIYKLVSLYATDDEEKKDLYQEVLLQAWKGWSNFRSEAKFSTWLYRITINTLLTYKRKVRPNNLKESLDHIELSTDSHGLKTEDTERLRKALRTLNEAERAIVSLHLEGYDNGEIASIIGISSNNVAVKLHRSKQQLSNLLKQYA